MCGIFASVGFEPDARHIDIVSHRGPDGRGWRIFQSAAGPVALGHRRLSIIDLDARANQPMSFSDDRFWITFNGRYYNFIELRVELERSGELFIRIGHRSPAPRLRRLGGVVAGPIAGHVRIRHL